jgi:hypothetical protein
MIDVYVVPLKHPIVPAFIYGYIPEEVKKAYKAAGVIPYAINKQNEPVILLGNSLLNSLFIL